MAVALLDIVSALGFLSAFIIVIKSRGAFFESYSKAFFCFSMGLYVFVGFSNILQHGNITDYFDRFEDYAEILFFPLIVFALYI